MELTDRQLVERVREGDREAFGDLVDRYRDMVYGLGYHLTGDFEAARDLAQDAFVQAYLKLAQLRDPSRFAGWLRQIATRVHHNLRRRKEVPTVALEEAGEIRETGGPSEIEVVVREALARLHGPERLALTLHYIDGYSHAEIGEFLGVRSETVKTRLARARQILKTEVMAMVEESFERNALPPEFRSDVVAAVERMVSGFGQALPSDLADLAARLPWEARKAWQDVLAEMPAPYGRPLKQQGEAPRAQIGDLPEALREQVRRAACLTWMYLVVMTTTEPSPWIRDFDTLWIRFYEADGSHYAWFADVPGISGNISSVVTGPEEGNPHGAPPRPDAVDRALKQCAMPELHELIDRLRRLVPGHPGSLGGALYTRMQQLMRQVLEQLPPPLRKAAAMGRGATRREAATAGQSISVRDLPAELQDLVRQAVYLHWGSRVLAAIEHFRPYLLNFDEARLEFGVYGGSLVTDPAGEYVIIAGPRPGDEWDQLGIS
ncbi:MAG: RNA polymerase sigma factor [Armatimonadota bacterium]